MSNLQLDYTWDELLSTHDVEEPLVLNGVRCHGGYLSDGTYVSPPPSSGPRRSAAGSSTTRSSPARRC